MPISLQTVATLRHTVRRRWRYWLAPRSTALSGREAAWFAELERVGFVVVPDFLSRAECAELIGEYHRLEQAYPQFVQEKSDRRIFGANRVSRPFRAFAEHPLLVRLAQASMRSAQVSCLTLSQHLVYQPGNLGSGEGWHRDSYSPQFKSIVYLTDVADDNGPFQIVPRSHRELSMAIDTVLHGIESGRKRFSHEEVEAIVRRRYPEGIRSITGPAGTLLLAVTSAIHRGKPIERGERYAMTNYFFPGAEVTAAAERQFGAIPRTLATV